MLGHETARYERLRGVNFSHPRRDRILANRYIREEDLILLLDEDIIPLRRGYDMLQGSNKGANARIWL